MRLPPFFYVAHICAFSIFSLYAGTGAEAVNPPVVLKSFEPNPVGIDQEGSLVLELQNPNSSAALTNVDVFDPLPDCIHAIEPLEPPNVTYVPAGCNTANNIVVSGYAVPNPSSFQYSQAVELASPNLPASADCMVKIRVLALSAGSCPNTTLAPESTQGSGLPAQATLNVSAVPIHTWDGSADSFWSNAANWDTPPAANDEAAVIPATAANKDNTNDTNWTYRLIELLGSGDFINGTNPITITGAIDIDVAGGTAGFAQPIMQTGPMSFLAKSGFLAVTQPIDNAGNDTTVIGSGNGGTASAAFSGGYGPSAVSSIAGGVAFNGVISGSGGFNVNGGLVGFAAANTFTGTVNVTEGTLSVTAPVTQEIDVSGSGTLTGPSESYKAIIVSGEGILQPGGTTPATWSTGPLTLGDGTEVVINFGSNNTTHSTINSTDAVTIYGGVLKLNFVATPTLGLTYGPLIATTTTRTGCPTEAVVCNPLGIEATPLCYLNVVAAKITATDAIFSAKMDEPHEGCP